MELQGTISLVLLAFGLGLLHALDADHVAAVSGLVQRGTGKRQSLSPVGVIWALGHGAAVLLIGLPVILLGLSIPHALSHYAETFVAVALILIGLLVWRGMLRRNLHFHFHRHEGMPPHAHWHARNPVDQPAPATHARHRHEHGPAMMGLLHGTAGAAPLLAVLPLTQKTSAFWGIVYLLVFCLGVLLSMLVFSGVLGRILAWTQERSHRLWLILRAVIGLNSVLLGAYLLARAA